jgi:uncharacterized protein (TIGR03083 family)
MTHDQPGDTYLAELAALLALDAVPADQREELERRAGPIPPDLLAAAAALADAVSDDPPPTLRDKVLTTARRSRPTGTAIGAPLPCSPADAYRRTADDLHRLLMGLSEDDWHAVAHDAHGPVRDLIAHLVGIEEVMLGWLGARPAADPDAVADHIGATRPTVSALSATDPETIAARWYELTGEVEAACRSADPHRPVLAHHLPVDVDALVVLRVFEIWVHTLDVCAAAGLSRIVPEPSRLALMSTRLMAALPMALAVRGTPAAGRTARFVLTGDAPGCYDVSDGTSVAPDPDVVIVADAVDVCQLAGRRLTPDDLNASIEGDSDFARLVLAAADAFALD